MTALPALLRRWPSLARRIPVLPLLDGPTAVEPAPELGRALDIGELWIKRDDATAAAYGGNKVRKLEFLFADARRLGYERVVTVGAIGSHHVLATAIHGQQQGIAVDAVLSPQALDDHVCDQLRLILATCRRCVLAEGYRARPRAIDELCRPTGAGDRGGYPIPAGGSTPVGALGFVSAALELEDQVGRGQLPPPQRIYTALGSCGTLAGLAVGLGLGRLPARVVAARVTETTMASRGHVTRLARGTAALLRRRAAGLSRLTRRWVRPSRFRIDERFFAPGYGEPRDDVDEALALARDVGGLVLEGTYTGRAFAALVADARAGRLRHCRVLFWHTLSSADLTPRLHAARSLEGVPAEFLAYLR
jgi:1-aminocyclopropane-1-carboxylate deaminase/D-cysteine desulfhydrase-like pyridoxal-dependent ACC family enzyme